MNTYWRNVEGFFKVIWVVGWQVQLSATLTKVMNSSFKKFSSFIQMNTYFFRATNSYQSFSLPFKLPVPFSNSYLYLFVTFTVWFVLILVLLHNFIIRHKAAPPKWSMDNLYLEIHQHCAWVRMAGSEQFHGLLLVWHHNFLCGHKIILQFHWHMQGPLDIDCLVFHWIFSKILCWEIVSVFKTVQLFCCRWQT